MEVKNVCLSTYKCVFGMLGAYEKNGALGKLEFGLFIIQLFLLNAASNLERLEGTLRTDGLQYSFST